MRSVHALVPDGYDDPGRASGGNVYDRRLLSGLSDLGWRVVTHPVADGWPRAASGLGPAVGTALDAIPGDQVVLVDGLLTAAPGPLLRHADRLALVVVAHMADPPGGPHPDVAARAALIVTTSAWTARELAGRLDLPPDRLVVAEPGVDPADPAEPSATGGRLLCVAAVTPDKGQDLLVDALADLAEASDVAERAWTCVCVGSLDRDPAYVERLRGLIDDRGLAARVRLVGSLDGSRLAAAYAGADLLVQPSRSESYGLVVTEALARGVPVIAAAAGGIPEALGCSPDGHRPGLLVAPDDPAALATALAAWLSDPVLRAGLRAAAAGRRATLTRWSQTALTVANALLRFDGG